MSFFFGQSAARKKKTIIISFLFLGVFLLNDVSAKVYAKTSTLELKDHERMNTLYIHAVYCMHLHLSSTATNSSRDISCCRFDQTPPNFGLIFGRMMSSDPYPKTSRRIELIRSLVDELLVLTRDKINPSVS